MEIVQINHAYGLLGMLLRLGLAIPIYILRLAVYITSGFQLFGALKTLLIGIQG